MRNARLLVLDQGDGLGAQVERVAAALRPRPEVLTCAEFESAEAAIAGHGPFDVLVAGPMASSDSGLRRVKRMRSQDGAMKLILAFEQWRSASVRDIVRTGALDVLRLPVEDGALVESIELALNSGPVRRGTTDEPEVPPAVASVTTVVSAAGGCGKTFVTTNFGYFLASRFESRPCLLDFDLQFGELATALRLRPKYTIADLLTNQADNDDLAPRLDEYLVRHDAGVHVLAAPEAPAQADAIDADDVARVIEAAQARFDHVIVDTSAALSDSMLVAIDHSDRIFVMATLDLPCVRNLGLLLSTFQQLKVPEEKIRLVLNKVEPDVGIDVAGMTRYFPQGFEVIVPYGREVNRSLNMGQPIMAYAPRSDVSKALVSGFTAVVSGRRDGAHPRDRWFSRHHKRSA